MGAWLRPAAWAALTAALSGCAASPGPGASRAAVAGPRNPAPSAAPALLRAGTSPFVHVQVEAHGPPRAPAPREEPKETPVTPRPEAPLDLRADPQGSVDGGGRSLHKNVFGGSVFDVATFQLGAEIILVLPAAATVAYGAPKGQALIYSEKSLAFMGHPPEGMPAAGVRQNIGCASRSVTGKLVVGTYGEWGSIEGGAHMALFVLVPPSTRVVTRAGLEGESSEAGTWPDGAPVAASEAGRIGYWYAATRPAPGWKAIASRPDPSRTARRSGATAPARESASTTPPLDDHEHAIEDFVTSHAAELAVCAEARPNLRAAVMTWRVVAGGLAEAVSVSPMAANARAFEECLVRSVQAWKFPASPPPVAVRASFVFDE